MRAIPVISMREVRFRAWDTKAKMMRHAFFEGKIATVQQSSKKGDTFKAKLQTDLELMQSTGLLDKNGKKIYEGDIICTKYPEHLKKDCSGLKYNQNYFHSLIAYSPESAGYNSLMDGDGGTKFGEIIGNIYENPELIEVKVAE